MFKVGSLITLRSDSERHYRVTNQDSICKVLDVIDSELVRVRVVAHKRLEYEIGSIYNVRAEHFRKAMTPHNDVE